MSTRSSTQDRLSVPCRRQSITRRFSKRHCWPAHLTDESSYNIYQAVHGENCGIRDQCSLPKSTCHKQGESVPRNASWRAIKDNEPYGVKTSGSSLTLHQLFEGRQVSPRVYFLDETKQEYEMLQLTGNEFTFDVDVSRLPCGMNSALYLSEMLADGGKSELNKGGANFGTGYCDAQCFTTPFINGELRLTVSPSLCILTDQDIWEANSRAVHVAPHPCNITQLYECTGDECAF
ncbi:endoglucanase EG-1 [Verticillium alfalfae VaMs.102]|uniref:cellulase n=1 Tax=Verticillium alfalfae (strain VaMs.102 / ATCC MYA-4576 / FGSC 10136) TaxID=526221 RepID=C9S863_VERA1|nr:endoglucanase EG-1 [Verticillium alfalfae VaMs.102]EEY15313.1 endoglucanase EG-1 [Verticillium alfalfae VaMs.102]